MVSTFLLLISFWIHPHPFFQIIQVCPYYLFLLHISTLLIRNDLVRVISTVLTDTLLMILHYYFLFLHYFLFFHCFLFLNYFLLLFFYYDLFFLLVLVLVLLSLLIWLIIFNIWFLQLYVCFPNILFFLLSRCIAWTPSLWISIVLLPLITLWISLILSFDPYTTIFTLSVIWIGFFQSILCFLADLSSVFYSIH